MSQAPTKPLHPLWELAMKASVPISIILGGALVSHEVRLGRIEGTMATMEWTRGEFPPQDLKTDIRQINTRLGSVETDLAAIRATIESLTK